MIIRHHLELDEEGLRADPLAINSVVTSVWRDVIPHLAQDKPTRVIFSVLKWPIFWFDETNTEFISVAARIDENKCE